VTVTVLRDNRPEGDDTLELRLADPVGATVADGIGVGTIRDDDARRWRAGPLWTLLPV